MNIQSMLKNFCNTILNICMPDLCIKCNTFVESRGICIDCWKKITWISEPKCSKCGRPFELDISAVCLKCLQSPPHFDKAISVCKYNEHTMDIILKFKYSDATYLAVILSAWMYRAAQDEINSADIITTVPMHITKRIKRLYNQTELLAIHIIKNCNSINYYPELLIKTKNTHTQKGLSANARKKNIKGSFAINKQYIDVIKNQSIILIDDVITTGTTINECAKILKKYGAAKVTVVTIAQT